ncbi:hypothetical protein [Nonomuraea pusilla]|uniref:Uncharacterized protein n=1 Tax=Nonomuraea pusilla TaxID=46177 RepID=A0A1H8IEE3_9ACTN|nr:hypothetical protein [Nonomuraea pusilla]SEN66671.1 hypothetical protein SAMN05660976_08027 [Nonomuraea pusilla]
MTSLFSVASAAALIGVDLDMAHEALSRLSDMGLLLPVGTRAPIRSHVKLLELVRQFVLEQSQEYGPAG